MAEFLSTNGIHFDYEKETLPITVDVPRVYCGACASVSILQQTVYTPDFLLYKPDKVFIEGKGRLTAKERRRILGLLRAHPTIDFRLVFMRNNPIYPRSKTKYMDWAKENGIKAVIGPELPKEWVAEFVTPPPKKRKKRK